MEAHINIGNCKYNASKTIFATFASRALCLDKAFCYSEDLSEMVFYHIPLNMKKRVYMRDTR
jgi:hypothetical protein